MEEDLGVFSLEIVNHEVYESILKQLDAQFNVGPFHDTFIWRDNRYTRFARYTKAEGEDPDRYLDDDDAQLAARALGAQPQTLISIHMNKEIGAINIAVDFVLLLAEHFSCVVVHEFRETSTPEEFIRSAESGYDGYRWDATRNAVVKGSPETPEEKSQRLQQTRKDKIFGAGGPYVKKAIFEIFTTATIDLEAFASLMHEVGAEMHSHQPFIADLSHNELGMQLYLLEGQHFQQWWIGLTEQYRTELKNRVGEPVQSRLELRTNSLMPSINLALDFMLDFAKRYPCIVQDGSGELHTPEELLEFAQPGYEGYEWNAEHTQVVKVQLEPPGEPRA